MPDAKAKLQYFRVRRGFTTSGHTLGLSSDHARWAVIRLWDEAKDRGGVFDTEAQLRECMGRYSRYVDELRAKRWLDGLAVHDWYDDQVNPEQQRVAGKRSAEARKALYGTAQPPQETIQTPTAASPGDRAVTASPPRRDADASLARTSGVFPATPSLDPQQVADAPSTRPQQTVDDTRSELNPSNDRSNAVRNAPFERPFEDDPDALPERPFEQTLERPVPNAPEPTETETELSVKGSSSVKPREEEPASSENPPGCPPGYIPDRDDPDLWWSPDGRTAWVHEHPLTSAQLEVRLRRTISGVQELIHAHGQNASYGRIRKVFDENRHWTVKDFEAALRHPATAAERPDDVLAFVSAVYKDGGICIVEGCRRRRVEAENAAAHKATQAEVRAWADSG